MDKETLSNYGWIVICVLVLAVMIALATPFGSFVSGAVQSTTQGLFDVNQSALNSTGLITVGDQEFDVPDMNHGAENGGANDGQPPVDAVKVATADELLAAVANGGSILLTDSFAIAKDTTLTVDKNVTLYAEDDVILTFGSNVILAGAGKLVIVSVDTKSDYELVSTISELVFNGGEHTYFALTVAGSSVVTINDGVFNFVNKTASSYNPEIILAQNGTLNINGGVINYDGLDGYGISLNGHLGTVSNVTVNVTGGVINANNECLFAVQKGKNTSANTHLNISGGNFTGNGLVLSDYDTWAKPKTYADGIASITGGTFIDSRTTDKDVFDEACVADGYKAVTNADGSITVVAE